MKSRKDDEVEKRKQNKFKSNWNAWHTHNT